MVSGIYFIVGFIVKSLEIGEDSNCLLLERDEDD